MLGPAHTWPDIFVSGTSFLQIYTANLREKVLKSLASIKVEMSQTGQKQQEDELSKVDSFICTDDEVELLLKVTMEYKTSNALENVDWESTWTKYDNILKHFNEQYPSLENSFSVGKDYPHTEH